MSLGKIKNSSYIHVYIYIYSSIGKGIREKRGGERILERDEVREGQTVIN